MLAQTDRDARTLGRSDARTPGRPDARTSGRSDVRTPGRPDAWTFGRLPPSFFNFCVRRGEGPSRAARSSRPRRAAVAPALAATNAKIAKNERKTRFCGAIISETSLIRTLFASLQRLFASRQKMFAKLQVIKWLLQRRGQHLQCCKRRHCNLPYRDARRPFHVVPARSGG